jgi:hypothetical protein
VVAEHGGVADGDTRRINFGGDDSSPRLGFQSCQGGLVTDECKGGQGRGTDGGWGGEAAKASTPVTTRRPEDGEERRARL